METLRGKIEEVIYHNKENTYTVAAVETQEGDYVTVVGYLPFAGEGRSFTFFGERKVHSNYGEQFSFYEYEEEAPTTAEAIEAFLASGIVKGIGPKSAKKLVKAFGEKTLEIMDEHPEKLRQAEGIGPKTAEKIAKSYQEHKEMGQVIMFLQSYGISSAYGMRLYKIYGNKTVECIKENPYRMIDDVYGIGFRTADAIAGKMGLARESEFRLASGVKYILSIMVSEGHTFLPEKELVERTANLLEVAGTLVRDALPAMALSGVVRMETIEGRLSVFLMPYYMAEANTCSRLIQLLNETHIPLTRDAEGLVRKAEGELGISLADNQREAVRAAIENGVCVITGGPGTGKTTTINTIIRIFEESGMETAIAAPTGRAAKRITETSGFEAKTIHRLLEYTFSGEDETVMRFGRNRENPLDADVIIIDEASMIDILLMNALLNGIKDGARLILVGDADQLPPVGAGNVLRDIIDSEMVHVVRLREIFRQAKESLITVNAHRINQGEYPYVNEKDKDFFVLQRKGEQEILDTIRELCCKRLPKYYTDLDPIRDLQVLTPVKKGLLGAMNLNGRLQEVLNPPDPSKKEKVLKQRIFREGDKVMQMRNNYELEWKREDDFSEGQGVFNGDIGYIRTIDTEFNEFLVIFEDVKAVRYDFTRMEELELAYAVTVHKSQGSEYPVVVMPLSWFPPMLATRNLLYTAVTRAKQAAVLVGNRNVMNAMVDNNRIVERYSGLKSRLSFFMEMGMEEETGEDGLGEHGAFWDEEEQEEFW